MLRINIMGESRGFQLAAARSAATYARMMPAARVTVWVPAYRPVEPELDRLAEEYGFGARPLEFPGGLDPGYDPIPQGFCRLLAKGLEAAGPEDIVLKAGADTWCNRAIELTAEERGRILDGGLGLAPDVMDRHCGNPADGTFVRGWRETYVNADVCFAGAKAVDFALRLEELSRQPKFRLNMFRDQAVMNYLLSTEFRGRLVPLDRKYNGMKERYNQAATVIGHCAGGATMDEGGERARWHGGHCARILGKG